MDIADKLAEFVEANGLKLKYWVVDDGVWWCGLENAEIKACGMLLSAQGDGISLTAATRACAERISGKLVVADAYRDNRREIQVPDWNNETENTEGWQRSACYQIECRNKVEGAIAQEGVGLARFLIDKNRKYGNSALDPVRIFSKAGTREQLLVRIDDKLNRWSTAADEDEDVLKDLIGYLILLRVFDRLEADRGQSA